MEAKLKEIESKRTYLDEKGIRSWLFTLDHKSDRANVPIHEPVLLPRRGTICHNLQDGARISGEAILIIRSPQHFIYPTRGDAHLPRNNPTNTLRLG